NGWRDRVTVARCRAVRHRASSRIPTMKGAPMSQAPDAKKDRPMPAASTINVIRHAEKPDAGKGLAPAGQKRAEAYVTYLQDLTSPTGTKIHWDHIFASEDSDNSDRAVLTVTPLANALNKKIHSQY